MADICARSRVLDTFILYNYLPSGGRGKMQERMQRTMDLLVSVSTATGWSDSDCCTCMSLNEGGLLDSACLLPACKSCTQSAGMWRLCKCHCAIILQLHGKMLLPQLKGVLKTAPPHKVFPLKDVHAAIAEHEKPGHGGRKVFLQ